MKWIIVTIILLFASLSYAENEIDCIFYRFHQVNHANQDVSGYAKINQSMRIEGLQTAKQTLALDGQKRATNSTNWFKLERDGWETFVTTFVGNSGEMLSIKYELGENLKGLSGWFSASLVTTTYTRLGKCKCSIK